MRSFQVYQVNGAGGWSPLATVEARGPLSARRKAAAMHGVDVSRTMAKAIG